MRKATHTLGCKLNFAETSNIVRGFVEAGAMVVDYHEAADLYVINTCTVTAIAEKKCRTIIRQAHRQNPDATIAVVGCFANGSISAAASTPRVSTSHSLRATAHAPFSKYRTDATISAPIVPYPLHAVAVVAPPLPRP